MQLKALEHLICACADISEDEDIVIVGSQAILGSHPDAPAPMLVSAKCVAGRGKDWAFATEALAHGLVDPHHLRARVDLLPVPEAARRTIADGLEARTARLVDRND